MFRGDSFQNPFGSAGTKTILWRARFRVGGSPQAAGMESRHRVEARQDWRERMVRMLDQIQAMLRGETPDPPVAGLVGFRLVEVAPGRAVFEMEAGPQH